MQIDDCNEYIRRLSLNNNSDDRPSDLNLPHHNNMTPPAPNVAHFNSHLKGNSLGTLPPVSSSSSLGKRPEIEIDSSDLNIESNNSCHHDEEGSYNPYTCFEYGDAKLR